MTNDSDKVSLMMILENNMNCLMSKSSSFGQVEVEKGVIQCLVSSLALW